MLIENSKLALASLAANKMRAFLTMLGIIIGIAAVIAIMTVGNSLQQSVKASMASMGVNNISAGFSMLNYDEDSSSEITPLVQPQVLKDMVSTYSSEIKAVSVQSSVGSGSVRSGNKTAKVSVSGVSAGYFVAERTSLSGGAFFTPHMYEKGSNVAIVSDRFAKSIFGNNLSKALGKEIEVNVDSNYTTYTIVGIYTYKTDNYSFDGSSGKSTSTPLYIPLKSAQLQVHNTDISDFTVVAKDGVDTTSLASEMQTWLNAHNTAYANYQMECYSMQSMIKQSTDMSKNTTNAMTLIAALALLVGGIGVMNIMTVSITERTREIGTRKALGAPNEQILLQFITEAIIICLIGGLIGIGLGIVMGNIASKVMGYPASISLASIAVSMGFSMFIGVFFGFYPANKAAKMNPIEALRYE